jgi:hypothetical protein
MAQTTTVILTDDLDGSAGDETVEFGLDGLAFEIDLSAVHAQELRDALGKYVDAARRANSRSKPAQGRRVTTPAPKEAAKIRLWAAEHGIVFSKFGRVPADVREKYEAWKAEQPGQQSA